MSVFDDMMAVVEASLGTRYQFGGNIVGDALDCSGFTTAVFAAAGINLPRVSADQARFGSAVSFEDARPGDLVWWDLGPRNNGADHIGFYLGNGMVAEASSSQGKTVIRRLWGNAQFTRVDGGATGGASTSGPPAGGGGVGPSAGGGGVGPSAGGGGVGPSENLLTAPGVGLLTAPGDSLLGGSGDGLSAQKEKSSFGLENYDMERLYALVEKVATSEDASTVGPYGVARTSIDRDNAGMSGLDDEIAKYQNRLGG